MIETRSQNLKINVAKLLTFFDEAPPDCRDHASAIAAIAAEDLGAGIFKYFLESDGNTNVTILAEKPSSGEKKADSLDRWIEAANHDGTGSYYQTGIINWPSHAVDGETLPLITTRAQERLYKIKQWEDFWDKESNRPKLETAGKVLSKMNNPAGFNADYSLHPLLIFWNPLHPLGAENFFFEQPAGKTRAGHSDFNSIWIFSVSAYLRSLGEKMIEVHMPDTSARLKWLSEIFLDMSF